MKRIAAVLVLVVLTGCAVRLGGPEPVEYRTLAVGAGADATAEEIAARIRASGADVAFLAAARDSAWFDAVARGAGLELSGPGRLDDAVAFGFLATEPVGDTTVALPLGGADGADSVWVHDALYEVDDERYLDLLALRVDDAVDVRAVARALLSYVATDVMPAAAVVLAVDAETAEAGERLAAVLEPAFADAGRCLAEADGEAGPSEAAAPPAPAAGVRLFYGPEARVFCRGAEQRQGSPLLIRLVVRR